MQGPCTAKRKSGPPCKNRAVRGADKCRMHLGKRPSLVIAEYEARELFGKVAGEITPVTNPLALYADLAGRVVAWMKTMDVLLDDLHSPRFTDDKGAEQIRGEVQLFERSMDRCNAVLASYARLKIDERLAAITVEQKRMVIAAIEHALASAGVTGEAASGAKRVAARHLRVVDAA